MENILSMTMGKKNYVIAIAGTSGSGKTVVSAKVSELLDKAPILAFDDYFEFFEGWPENIRDWLDKGANTDELQNIQMMNDIKTLKEDKSIIHPTTKETLHSTGYIIVEDPSGKERKELAGLIDFLVYIDVPLDIALMRVLRRFIDNDVKLKDGSKGKIREEAPDKLLNTIENFLENYQEYYRELYIVICDRAREKADFIVDGLQSIDVLATLVVEQIANRRVES